jgi:hypothetical protein
VNVAPPWFAGAINAALSPIQHTLDRIQASLDALAVSSARAQNSSATLPEHALVGIPIPVPGGLMKVPTPVVNQILTPFPATFQALLHMSDPEIRAFLQVYGLPVAGADNTNSKRKNEFAQFIGVRMKMII